MLNPSYRQGDRLEDGRPVEDARQRAEEDTRRLGRAVQGVHGEVRIHQARRGAQTQVCRQE